MKALRGKMLPPGFARMIALYIVECPAKAKCQISSRIPNVQPHTNAGLYSAVEEVFAASLPLLAKLKSPSLLLPGQIQAVVKAQKIVMNDKETYEGKEF